jgi:hypothetical protein
MADEENLARYHKKAGMTFCSENNERQQEKCKFYEKSTLKPGCAWRNTHIVFSHGGDEFKHCREPDAQKETYANCRLQI